MSACVFCQFIQTGSPHHEKVWEDEHHIAFLSIEPVTAGHTLVVPKTHCEYVFDMDQGDYEKLMNAVRTVAVPLKQATASERVVLAFEGYSVPHVHAHLIPSKKSEGGVMFESHKATAVELAEAARMIRPAFTV